MQVHLPVTEAQFRPTTLQRWLYPLLLRLQRVDMNRWGAFNEGQLMGYLQVSARRVPKTTHELRLMIDPQHRTTLVEPLLTFALRILEDYPAQNTLIEVRNEDEHLLSVLKQYGFVEIETQHRLGVRLEISQEKRDG